MTYIYCKMKNFQYNAICATCTLHKGHAYSQETPNFSSETMLRKDYDCKGSVFKKKTFVVSLKRLGAKMNRLTVNR
jgi:hypothetical protein